MFPRDTQRHGETLARPLLSIIALATSERLLTSESFKEPAGKIKKCGNGDMAFSTDCVSTLYT